MSWGDTEKNQLRRENAQLRAELEAAKKVADEVKYRAMVFADTAFEARYEAMRKVADAAVAEQFVRHVYHRIRAHEPRGSEARGALAVALSEVEFALQHAVQEYRLREYRALSPSKRAALNAAYEKLDDEQALENLCKQLEQS